jgi:hypothetical protein
VFVSTEDVRCKAPSCWLTTKGNKITKRAELTFFLSKENQERANKGKAPHQSHHAALLLVIARQEVACASAGAL